MIYQINGKRVKNKPKGKFAKVVTVPGKLMNFITTQQELATTSNYTIDFWQGARSLWKRIFNKFQHIALVRDKKLIQLYLDGKLIITMPNK